MCENYNDVLIKVGEKTVKGKYDFLSFYYNKWNQITKPRPRFIIDTHAGSGMVSFESKDILNKYNKKRIFGSPLLAMLKTITISDNLTIILNESDDKRYFEMRKHTEYYKENGFQIFKPKQEKVKIRDIKTHRKKLLKYSKKLKKIKENPKKIIYPDSPDDKPPPEYDVVIKKTKANIIFFNRKIEDIICDIIKNNLKEIKFKDKTLKPISVFFVDPCGTVGWNDVIKKICILSSKKQGIELILNWSWDAINRNPHNKKKILSEIYGISIKDIEREFNGFIKMDQYLKKYITQLKEYFKYVNIPIKVLKGLKLTPKQNITYILIYCSNNKSGQSLAGYKEQKSEKERRKYIKDMNEWIRPKIIKT